MEIITGVERRRRWRVEDKLRIVAEAESPIEISLPDGTCIRVGADVGLVALRRVIAAVRR